MAVIETASYCPRCDEKYIGAGATLEEAKKDANNMVREHLQRALGADLDEGLHDNALELWDATPE